MHDVYGGYLPAQPGKPKLRQLSRSNLPFNLNGGDRLFKLCELRPRDVLQCGGRKCVRLLPNRSIRLIHRPKCLCGVFCWDLPSVLRVKLMRNLCGRLHPTEHRIDLLRFMSRGLILRDGGS